MKGLSRFCSVFAIAACAASAHDELPIRSMAESMGAPIVIGSFVVTHAELQAEVARQQGLAARCVQLQQLGADPTQVALELEPPSYRRYPESTFVTLGALRCGGIQWRAATHLARQRCEQMSSDLSTGTLAFPLISSPKSYSAPDHHTGYHIDDGDGELRGDCVVLSPVAPIENSTH